MAILVQPSVPARDVQALDAAWQQFLNTAQVVFEFKQSSRFALVHLDIFNGEVAPAIWDEGGGPDYFEVEIGNRVAYAAPLDQAGSYFEQLQARWLPYYAPELRERRLGMV